jgi:hypothetical protein
MVFEKDFREFCWLLNEEIDFTVRHELLATLILVPSYP